MIRASSQRSVTPLPHAIVLAGGAGTRLWPLSRGLFPKHLLAFEDDLSLLQLTLQRISGLFDPARIHIVTNEDHVFEVRKQARVLDSRLEAGVLAEPRGRNTLPALLLGLDAAWPVNQAEAPLAAVFPADHAISSDACFAQAVSEGLTLADQGWFVTFGVVPHSPETGYGYIERADIIPDLPGGRGFRVARFVEKPDRTTAESFLRDGRYFWNSGMFVYPGRELLAAVRTWQPALARWWDKRATCPLVSGYAAIPSISIDYGIMEKVARIAVVETGFGWDDLGNWEALYRLARKDERGCATRGDVLALDCENSLLFSRSGKLAAVGVKDMIAVQTRDATLICARDQVQRVKEIVERLRDEKSPLADMHLTVQRPWGSYTVLEEGLGYKIKRIAVTPGGSLSLQYHRHRAEHWVVVRGTAEVWLEDVTHRLAEQEWIVIPAGSRHQLANRENEPLDLIEIQSGSYLEEDDIVRLDDVYGR